MTNVPYKITEKFGSDYIDAGHDEVRYQCPFCKDLGKTYEDYKLYVNTKKGVYWCHRCHAVGYLNSDEFLQSNFDIYDSLEKIIYNDSRAQSYFELPSDLALEGSAYNYLINRGISDRDIRYYSIRYEPIISSSKLAGRVVIPNKVINFDFTDMYNARSYIDSPKRYYNPPNSLARSLIFNMHRIKDNCDRLIVNEGAINSIVAGRDSIATYGKFVSNEKVFQIVSKNPKTLFISLDKDAIDDSYKLASRIRRMNSRIEIRIVDLPLNEDASSLGRDRYLDYVENSKVYNDKLSHDIYKYIDMIK